MKAHELQKLLASCDPNAEIIVEPFLAEDGEQIGPIQPVRAISEGTFRSPSGKPWVVLQTTDAWGKNEGKTPSSLLRQARIEAQNPSRLPGDVWSGVTDPTAALLHLWSGDPLVGKHCAYCHRPKFGRGRGVCTRSTPRGQTPSKDDLEATTDCETYAATADAVVAATRRHRREIANLRETLSIACRVLDGTLGAVELALAHKQPLKVTLLGGTKAARQSLGFLQLIAEGRVSLSSTNLDAGAPAMTDKPPEVSPATAEREDYYAPDAWGVIDDGGTLTAVSLSWAVAWKLARHDAHGPGGHLVPLTRTQRVLTRELLDQALTAAGLASTESKTSMSVWCLLMMAAEGELALPMPTVTMQALSEEIDSVMWCSAALTPHERTLEALQRVFERHVGKRLVYDTSPTVGDLIVAEEEAEAAAKEK